MRTIKITLRLSPELTAQLLRYAKATHRGTSNAITALLSRALRSPVPPPDRPLPEDRRYTRGPT